MKRSSEIAKQVGRGKKRGRKRATERDLCPARLAMCASALASSTSVPA